MKYVAHLHLAQQLKARRLQVGFTQEDVAVALGINQSTFTQREMNGFPGGTLGQWMEWAEVLEMNLEFTLSATEQHPLPSSPAGNRKP